MAVTLVMHCGCTIEGWYLDKNLHIIVRHHPRRCRPSRKGIEFLITLDGGGGSRRGVGAVPTKSILESCISCFKLRLRDKQRRLVVQSSLAKRLTEREVIITIYVSLAIDEIPFLIEVAIMPGRATGALCLSTPSSPSPLATTKLGLSSLTPSLSDVCETSWRGYLATKSLIALEYMWKS
jgi:hypothetical protein